jgi:uncharacterized protein (DUF342 family)
MGSADRSEKSPCRPWQAAMREIAHQLPDNDIGITKAEETTSLQQSETVSVRMAPDRLAAYIRFSSDSPSAWPCDPDCILKELHAAGVNFGIDEAVVREAAQGGSLNEDIQVAWGTAAVPGENARIEIKIKLDIARTPKFGPDGRVDYKNVDSLQNAVERRKVTSRARHIQASIWCVD